MFPINPGRRLFLRDHGNMVILPALNVNGVFVFNLFDCASR